MKVAIYGVGAIGGLLAARLSAGGHQVSAVARGATLAALQNHGIRLHLNNEPTTHAYPVVASDNPAQLGVQDVVVIAVKVTALAEIAAQIAPLLGPETIILPAINGVPWWFFELPGVALHGRRFSALDPHGHIAQALPVAQVLGCVVHLSASSSEPGCVQVAKGNRLIIGEPDGSDSVRLRQVATVLQDCGFEVVLSQKIRDDIWYKLWGNMTMNPITAMTGVTGDLVLDDELVKQFCMRIMHEAADIGQQIGCPIAESSADRMKVTRQLGAFRTSMLQDVESNKPIELDALLGVVHEIGLALAIPTPNIDALFGLARLFGRNRKLYP